MKNSTKIRFISFILFFLTTLPSNTSTYDFSLSLKGGRSYNTINWDAELRPLDYESSSLNGINIIGEFGIGFMDVLEISTGIGYTEKGAVYYKQENSNEYESDFRFNWLRIPFQLRISPFLTPFEIYGIGGGFVGIPVVAEECNRTERNGNIIDEKTYNYLENDTLTVYGSIGWNAGGGIGFPLGNFYPFIEIIYESAFLPLELNYYYSEEKTYKNTINTWLVNLGLEIGFDF